MMYATGQPYGPGWPSGRMCLRGYEWFACDPYPTWFRWEDDKLIFPPSSHHWADETLKGKPAISKEIAARFDPDRHNCMFLDSWGWRPTYLYNADMLCKHESDGRWSGIGCKYCNGWFCL